MTSRMALAGAEVLHYLAGHWRLERVIHDASSGQRGTFQGHAQFSLHLGGAIYREEGRLRWPTYDGPASRTLRYQLTRRGDILVCFNDGRPFHSLDLRAGTATFSHPCGPDRYIGSMAVLSRQQWQQVWQVHGPGAMQEIRSRYRRTVRPRCAGGLGAGQVVPGGS